MTRVAKARRRAALHMTSDQFFADGYDRQRAQGPAVESGEDPWSLNEDVAGGLREAWAGDAGNQIPPEGDQVPPQARTQLVGLLRRLFLPAPVGAGVKSVLMCGADGAPDLTSTCRQAAALLSTHTSRTVCLVEAGTPGSMDLAPADPVRASGPRPLFRVAKPAGSTFWRASAGELSTSPAFEDPRRWLADLAARFDYVLVDGPGTGGADEPSALALLVDGVVLVVDESGTRRDVARSVAETLHASGARLLGVALVNWEYPIPASIYSRL